MRNVGGHKAVKAEQGGLYGELVGSQLVQSGCGGVSAGRVGADQLGRTEESRSNYHSASCFKGASKL